MKNFLSEMGELVTAICTIAMVVFMIGAIMMAVTSPVWLPILLIVFFG